ncbi:MAG: hypothetical protein PHF60_01710 [Candidatus ainarchaeum sp.]|nr:hypothetical protein [Candidatus ainarchaeum sp.]
MAPKLKFPGEKGPDPSGFKPNWPSLPDKSRFTAIPIADPDTNPSLVMARQSSSRQYDPVPMSREELAKGPYRRVSKDIYELDGNSHNGSRGISLPSRVICVEDGVNISHMLNGDSLDKNYGTYLITWDKISGFRKLPKTSAEPKGITMQDIQEFRRDAEAAAKKNPGGEVDRFIKNHPAFYDDPVIKVRPSDIIEAKELKSPPPIPHSVISVTVVELSPSNVLDVTFNGERRGETYTIGYEPPLGSSKGKLVKMATGSSEKHDPSNKERSAFRTAVCKARDLGNEKVKLFLRQYPDAIA